MLRWFFRRLPEAIDAEYTETTVDEHEARLEEAAEARRAAEEQLNETRALGPQIRALVRIDRQLRSENHFAEIVYNAFRGI